MTPVRKITVTDIEVSISVRPDSNDYISLTDMAHFKDKDRTNYIIQNWMRLRSTIDFWDCGSGLITLTLKASNSMPLNDKSVNPSGIYIFTVWQKNNSLISMQ